MVRDISQPVSPQRENANSVSEHPGWCSPAHCYRIAPEGVRVHMQAPVCWEQDDELTPTRFKTGLLAAEHEPFTYLELELRTFVGVAHTILSLTDARRLRDQLSAHLEAAESARRNRVLSSSDEPADGAE